MSKNLPTWDAPSNIEQLLKTTPDSVWDTEAWAPLRLAAIGNTVFLGRTVPVAWQIEFDPFDDEFEPVNEKLANQGKEPSGYAWAELIEETVKATHPELSDKLHLGDTELDTCVVWVEEEQTCKTLLTIIWKLVFG